jgi:hypothetical protein
LQRGVSSKVWRPTSARATPLPLKQRAPATQGNAPWRASPAAPFQELLGLQRCHGDCDLGPSSSCDLSS